MDPTANLLDPRAAPPRLDRPRRRAAVPLLLVAATLLLAPAPGLAKSKSRKDRKKTVVVFDSRLKDDANKPVSGVFPMVFEIRKSKRSRRSMWKEKHWVAIDNGRYEVKLGLDKALPSKFDASKAIIAVSIAGAGQVLEEPLAGADASVTEVEDSGGKRIVQYAEKAGFAYDAEKAAAADRLGTWTAEKLGEEIEKLKRRKAKVTVGRNRINLTMAGGVGGTPFEQMCPPGTVVVGIRGAAGLYLDQIQAVCAPLE